MKPDHSCVKAAEECLDNLGDMEFTPQAQAMIKASFTAIIEEHASEINRQFLMERLYWINVALINADNRPSISMIVKDHAHIYKDVREAGEHLAGGAEAWSNFMDTFEPEEDE